MSNIIVRDKNKKKVKGNFKGNDYVYLPPIRQPHTNKYLYVRVKTQLESPKQFNQLTPPQIRKLAELRLLTANNSIQDAFIQELFNLDIKNDSNLIDYFPLQTDDKQDGISIVLKGGIRHRWEITYRIFFNIHDIVDKNPLYWDITYDAVYDYISKYRSEIEAEFKIEHIQDIQPLKSCVIQEQSYSIKLDDVEVLPIVQYAVPIENFNIWAEKCFKIDHNIRKHILKLAKIVLG